MADLDCDTFQDAKMDLDNPAQAVEHLKQPDIDESLYSRQLYVTPLHC